MPSNPRPHPHRVAAVSSQRREPTRFKGSHAGIFSAGKDPALAELGAPPFQIAQNLYSLGMGQIIEFPLHRARRHLSCDQCGHPTSVRLRTDDSVCRLCNGSRLSYHCYACDSKHVECHGCASVFAGTDEIF